MVNNSLQGHDCLCSCVRVLDRSLEIQINDIIRVVGNIRSISIHSQASFATSNFWKSCNAAQCVLVAELHNLNWHGILAPSEPVYKLGLIHNAHKFIGCHLDHLLAKKSASTSLDNIQLWVNLIRTINGNIKLWLLIQRRQGNAQRFRLFISTNRRWYSHNILQFPRFEKRANAIDSKGSRGTCTQSHNHAALHILDSLPCSLLLQFILTELCSGHIHLSCAN
mmetsp:Transcript_12364/g.24853  ORF Transcript_12364/g.24853 Transcript_12364/m.24853 type:complete len:223 (+) Transcript_12364:154-822(+)